MKYLTIAFVFLFTLGCKPAKKLVTEDKAIKNEETTTNLDIEGNWYMTSIGDHELTEDESGTIAFTPSGKEALGHGNTSISASIGCNSLSAIFHIEKNAFKFRSFCHHAFSLVNLAKATHAPSKRYKKTQNVKTLSSLTNS